MFNLFMAAIERSSGEVGGDIAQMKAYVAFHPQHQIAKIEAFL